MAAADTYEELRLPHQVADFCLVEIHVHVMRVGSPSRADPSQVNHAALQTA